MAAGKLPSETQPRSWRTRRDVFEDDWPELEAMLTEAPELQAKTLFSYLQRERPGTYDPGQLRTLQRRVRDWRALHGPPKEVFFPQWHRPGEYAQTDFTNGDGLGITIAGEPFDHLLCHSVLTYSNYESVTVCRSESMTALRRGIQAFVFGLGCAPQLHQTDNSTAATHGVSPGKREYNEEYLALMRHFGMKPRTIQIGKSNQNGDVESSNDAVKNRIRQHLILRGSRDFESTAAYESFVQGIVAAANQLREEKVAEEKAVMAPIRVLPLPEYSRLPKIRVTAHSTIRVKENSYSVPSRLIGEPVLVHLFDDRLEVYFMDALQLTTERLLGKKGHRIDYRHVIASLIRKPGAFARYRYREDLFPTVTFRVAYDALQEGLTSERRATLEYLRLLEMAALTMECEVEAAICLLLEAGQLPESHAVKALVEEVAADIPDMEPFEVDLGEYDGLLQANEVVQ